MVDYKKQGKKNRAAGARFELKVRKDLESKGWIVLKNPNNVVDKQFIQGKSKYNPFTKRLMMNSAGFPDFVAFTKPGVEYAWMYPSNEIKYREYSGKPNTNVIGVEAKSNGYLTKEEKEKIEWLLSNKIFSKVLIAMKDKKKRGGIIYNETTSTL